MWGSRCRAVPVYLLLITLMLAWTLAPEAAPAAKQVLRLRSAGAFDPAVAEPAVAGEVSLQAAAREHDQDGPRTRGRGHYIVQFDGPVQEHWKANLQAKEAQLLGYVPDNAFVVRAPRGKSASFRKVGHVRAVTPLHPAYLLSPDLPKRGEGRVDIRVTTFTPEDVPALARRVRQLNGRVDGLSVQGEGTLLARVPASALKPLARVFGVSWIEPNYPARTFNGVAGDILNVDLARANVGLHGANQIVAVCDTGLDTGDANSLGIGTTAGTMHEDFRGRILAAQAFNNRSGAWSDFDGHGTHVAGSVLGSGVSGGADPSTQNYGGSGGYAGVAPEAYLVMQSMANANGTLLSNVSDIYAMFQAAHDVGARIHTNSWGAGLAGQYTSNSRSVDRFMWDHPDHLILFAAGNEAVDGVDTNNDGVLDLGHDGIVDNDSMGSPATAKNCLTVGASESLRTTGGFFFVWGNFDWLDANARLFNFNKSPLVTDPVSNNAEGVAAFSSRGPCDDTRIKPDVVAPGTYIASARTHLPLADYVEGGNAGWTLARSTTSVPLWSRETTGGAHTGTLSWYVSQQNSTGAEATSDFQQVLNTEAISCRATAWMRRSLGTGTSLEVAYSTNGVSFTTLTTYTSSTGGMGQVTLGTLPAAPSVTLRFRFKHAASLTDPARFVAIDDIRVYPVGGWGKASEVGLTSAGTSVDENYVLTGGTSMSTPLVAGACALARQYYQEVVNHRTPSAALIKATVMAGAKDLAGQYSSEFNELGAARPNNAEGWGRVDLEKSLPHPGAVSGSRLLFFDNARGLRTGEADTYTFNAVAGTALNVVLVYTDRPGAAMTAVNLVNNLDLDLTAPNATAYSGNGTASDDRNNVEGVDLAAGAVQTGVYTLTLSGTSTPEGPQPYAVVVYGNVSPAAALTVTPSAARVVRGQNYQFAALFNGRITPGVTWSVQSGGGSISSAGLYTAPVSGTSATVRATFGSLTADSVVTLVDGDAVILFTLGVSHTNFSEVTTVRFGTEAKPGFAGFNSGNISVTSQSPGSYLFLVSVDPASNAANFLPPSDVNQWWLEVGDSTANGNSGTISTFRVTFNGTTWESVTGSVAIPGGGTARKWIDYTPPTASITAPTNGQSVSGSTTISATASDNDRVVRVEFYEDDRLLGTDSTAPYILPWDTTGATNMPHRVSVKTYDLSSNVSEAFVVVGTNNTGARPNVVTGMSGWSFNSSTRVMTATLMLNNTGSDAAHRVSLQRLTLFGTGPSFTGTKAINMQPSTGGAFPRYFSQMNAGGTQTLTLTATLPPEITAIPRWTVTGNYYDQASGGNQFRL